MKQPERELSPEWVGKGPLADVCLSIVRASLATHTKPDGAILAHLARRLIAAETEPGGPYRNDAGQIDLPTNLAIGYLCAFLTIPLPQVDAYIKVHRSEAKSREVKRLLKKYDALGTSGYPSDLHKRTFARAASKLSRFDDPLKTLSLDFLDRMQKADTNQEIALFPTIFRDSLLRPAQKIPLDQLGEANIYCWTAYTMYDHLLDGQSSAQYLPVANIAMRLALTSYQALFPLKSVFQRKIIKVFNEMDTANSWEQAHCRFTRHGNSILISSPPKYGRLSPLARRSFGHALGPLAIAYLSGHTAASQRDIERGMRHYLIARQLSDDLHDWQDDLSAGSCTAILATLLRHGRVQPGTYAIDTLTLRLQEVFWQRSLASLTRTLHTHTRHAREAFIKSGAISSESPLFTLLSHLDTTAVQSLHERDRYKAFAAAYSLRSTK